MNNKQYPDRPSSGGDGDGNDDGSGFSSPSRLNHPYQQQQHPHQSSHGHEGDRSSRNHTHHIGTGGNHAGSYSPYGSHFNQPYYNYNNNNNNNNNSNNRHQPVGSGPPPPPPPPPPPMMDNTNRKRKRRNGKSGCAQRRRTKENKASSKIAATYRMYLQMKILKSCIPAVQDQVVVAPPVVALAKVQDQVVVAPPAVALTKDQDIVASAVQDQVVVALAEDQDVVAPAVQDQVVVAPPVVASYYQQQLIQPQPENTKTEELLKKMLLKSEETQKQQETDMKKMETRQKEMLETMETMQTMLLQRQSEPDRVGAAVRQQNAMKSEPQELIVIDDDEIVIKKENDDETTGAELQHPSEMDMGMHTVTPASSASLPSTTQATSSNGERQKRKVAETSQAHKSRVNTQGLISVRRRTVRTNTKTNSSKRYKITVGSQKVHEITVMEPKAVIKVAIENIDDEKIQGAACERLRKILTSIDKDNMTSIDKDNAKNIISIDGVQMICNAMKKHRGQSMVISEGCLAVTKFIEYYPDVSSKIADEGVIDFIIAAISRWSKSSSKKRFPTNKVLERGCEALNQLSNCVGNVRKIINSDGMNVVQTAMKNYPDRIDLLNMGCYFLIQMTHYCMDTSPILENRVITATEVVPIILKAVLSKKKVSVEVQCLLRYHVCVLITNFAALPAAKKKVNESALNAIAIIIKIWNATDDENADHVKKVAITAIQHLASDSQAKIQKELFLAIKSNRDHSLQLVRTLHLIKKLCINDEKIAHKIALKDGIDIIMNVLKNKSAYVTVQVAAFSVISAIGGKSKKYASDLAAAIIVSMKNHNDNRKVQLSGCDSLFKISHHPSTHKIFKKMNLLKLLIHVKKDYRPRRKRIDELITICKLPISFTSSIAHGKVSSRPEVVECSTNYENVKFNDCIVCRKVAKAEHPDKTTLEKRQLKILKQCRRGCSTCGVDGKGVAVCADHWQNFVHLH